jgi:hypothetical protein
MKTQHSLRSKEFKNRQKGGDGMAKIEATLTIFDDGTFELKDDKGLEIPVVNEVSNRYKDSAKIHGHSLPKFINSVCWYSGSPI